MCKPILSDTICGIPLGAFSRKPTPAEIAGLFCALDDDSMAEFFVAVAKIAETWDGSAGMQWHATGKHLATCDGACDGAEVVLAIARPIQRQHA